MLLSSAIIRPTSYYSLLMFLFMLIVMLMLMLMMRMRGMLWRLQISLIRYTAMPWIKHASFVTLCATSSPCKLDSPFQPMHVPLIMVTMPKCCSNRLLKLG